MHSSVGRSRDASNRLSHWLWLGPLLYGVLLGVYFVARYGGHWAEADSAAFTKILRAFVNEGRITPVLGPVYPNGFAYQAISAYVIALTGLDVSTLQQIVYPLIVGIAVLPAWVLFRELGGSWRAATFATVLLLSQPEFLFVTLRSSHEKFTRVLTIMSLYLLVRSFRYRDRPGSLAVNVSLFCLTTFALIASNSLLAHSFIVALLVAQVLAWVLGRWFRHLDLYNSSLNYKLQTAVLLCLVIFYVFTFYVYKPAQHDLLVLKHMWERVATLFLDVQAESTTYADPYGVVTSGWVSLGAYFAVSAANWLILALSFGIWVSRGIRWIVRGEVPESRGTWLLWLLYAAFAVQGALSMVVDSSGALTSNLQYRLFPMFSIVAVAMVGSALSQWRPRRWEVPLRLTLSAVIFCIAILSVFKATNEPLVSNKWTFYRPSEITALVWSDTHLRFADIWTEYDERLVVALDTVREGSTNHNQFQGYRVLPGTRTMVITDVTRLRSRRLGQLVPVPADGFRVYDNGEAEVYHLRPVTPFQP